MFREVCAPDVLACSDCLLAVNDLDDCAASCAACGADLPTGPAARARNGNDVGLAASNGVSVVGAFCAKCSRVVRSLVPTAKSVRI
jgi:hypothetical protein